MKFPAFTARDWSLRTRLLLIAALASLATLLAGSAAMFWAAEKEDQRLLDSRLEDLAREAQLSPFHFLRRFKASTRHTPQVFVQARRGARAKALLAQGLPAAEVAAAVGLVDQPHLTRLLRRQFGITPGQYQRQLGF